MGLSIVRVGGSTAIILAIALAAITGCSSGTSVLQNPNAPSAPLALTDVFVIEGTPQSGNAVMRFKATSPGNSAPVSTAIPSGAMNIISVANDGQGSLYAGVTTGTGSEILVFPTTTNGTITPSRTITGGSDSFTYPYQLTVDAGGALYVLDNICNCVVIYSTAAGQTTPLRIIQGDLTQINDPVAIAVDSAGNLYVADHFGKYPNAAAPDGAQVEMFAPGASGDAAPAEVITGTATAPWSPITGMAVDASSNLYIDFGPKIVEYAASSKGVFTLAKTIIPPATEAQSSTLRFDASGNIFILWLTTALTPGIAVYPRTTTGFDVPESPFPATAWTGTPASGQFALN